MRYCDRHDRMFDEFAPCQGCAAAALGSLGGKAGTGEAKRRGDSAYYKALRAKVKRRCPKIPAGYGTHPDDCAYGNC